VPVADICRVCTGVAVIVWFCGPIAKDDSVGLTKKPVHPAATASVKSTAASKMVRLELNIIANPSTRDVSCQPESAYKIVADEFSITSAPVPMCDTSTFLGTRPGVRLATEIGGAEF
jgi:hypothetical protein